VSTADESRPVREEDAVDVGAVVGWLRAHTDADVPDGEPEVRQFPGGASNLTYLLRWSGPGRADDLRELILRRPPAGAKARGAHDMGREYLIQHALGPVYPYVAGMVGLCTDASVLGSDFYVMERLDGVILRKDLGFELSPAGASTLCEQAWEAFVRLHEAGEVDAPKAWLSTVVTRLAIDHLRSARVRREQYPGTWLPEPVLADPAPEAVASAEDLSLAVLVLLESLTPVERAVFVLREAFDYGYDEIAEIVDKSPANVRQLAVRARRHVDERRPRFEPSREQREELVKRFIAALHDGETGPLVEMLATDAAFYGDGGGKAASVGPLHGRDRIAPVLARSGAQVGGVSGR